jgi:hypothetical protein
MSCPEYVKKPFLYREVSVPEYGNKPAHFAKGLQNAIIDESTFYKVQDVLDSKKKSAQN